jgi:hypothetical protein
MLTITIVDDSLPKGEQQVVGKIEVESPQKATVTGDVSAIETYRNLIENYGE